MSHASTHHAPAALRSMGRAAGMLLSGPAPGQGSRIDDGRQVDLEEALGRFGPNEAATRALNLHLGQRLRARRAAYGLAMPALGARVGRSGQQIQKYEIGQDAIKAATLYQLATVLDVSIEWFFEGVSL